jgi:threonyl-tRNA synthetase
LRILQLHSNSIRYFPVKKEIALAEECEQKEKYFEDIIVIFTCIENEDTKKTAHKAIDELNDFLNEIKVKRILIYPFAHLSNNLATPNKALILLQEMENYAKGIDIETYRAPFGWCKELSISIKGHPLAEQFKKVTSEDIKDGEIVSKALEAEKKIKSSWFILEPNGNMVQLDKFNFTEYKNLKYFADYEISKVREVKQVPPHVSSMRKLELVDYEPASDSGNFRWYPKGRLIKSLLEELVTTKVTSYGGMEVETPIMYDLQHPSLASYLSRFPARQYILKSDDKDYFLRFSACFGQFLMIHDTQISYRQLPLKIYELTKYSFRREKSGELSGLRRLRGFTMPDVHAFCANIEQAKEEFLKRFKMSVDTLEEFEINKDDFELAIRFTKDFYQGNKQFILSLLKILKKPALVEVWDEQFFYFILKWEFNFIDNLKKASALSTDQIDIENAERWGIKFINKNGDFKNPLILHCSPSGAIERNIYAILEKAHMMQKKGKAPTFPLWLAPTQVRIIPVADKFLDETEKISKEIMNHDIRVDFDDRTLTIKRKIRDAEKEWIPYIIVIGKKEIDSGLLAVRDRYLSRNKSSSNIRLMPLKDLVDNIKKQTKGKPFKPLSLPISLTKRPRFFG